jgi:hypothetical protein
MGAAVGINNGGAGAPVLTITEMPSLAACEEVGRVAKMLVDSEGESVRGGGSIWGRLLPARYRCVRVK